MNTVATNVRFPADEYQELKLLAFSRGQSTASLVRQAVSFYTKQKLTAKLQVSLVEKLKKMAVKIDIPVLKLVNDGRKFI
jgi:predicted DNA-binding protein